MVRSIKAHPVTSFAWFVGIKKGARDKSGGDLYNIAKVHEYGATITPKKAKALAVPVTRKAKRVDGPRNYPGELTPIYTKKGRKTNVIGILKEGRRSREVTAGIRRITKVAYVLLKKSIIPPRPTMKKARVAYERKHPRATIKFFNEFWQKATL